MSGTLTIETRDYGKIVSFTTRGKMAMTTLHQSKDLEDRLKPLFTETDYEIVRQAMLELPRRERVVVHLHFWSGLSCADIAYDLGISWRSVDMLLSQALRRLRAICISNPVFSRGELFLLAS